MKLSTSTVLCAIALASAATALPAEVQKSRYGPLPAGSPNGLYVSTVNEDGSLGWKHLGSGVTNTTSDVTARAAADAIGKRAPTGVYCQGNSNDAYDWENAATQLIQNCGNGLAFEGSIAFQSNTAVAYGCDYGYGQICHGGDVSSFMDNIRSSCGEAYYGWWSQENWKASYGVTSVQDGWC